MSALPFADPFCSPENLEEALALLAQGGWRPIAGGTDFYPAHVNRPIREALLNLQELGPLRGITCVSRPEAKAVLRIGALSTWTDLRVTRWPAGLEALADAAAEIGGLQVQNRGTLGGNVCNASPAADSVPVLLALNARVELLSVRGRRQLGLADFILGNRRTARAPDELLVAIEIPLPSSRARSIFFKLGHRRFLVISVVMLAVMIDVDSAGRIEQSAIAVGACSEVAQRLHLLEESLLGCASESAAERAAQLLHDNRAIMLQPLSAIDDVRGTASYRLDALGTLIPRALSAVAEHLPKGPEPREVSGPSARIFSDSGGSHRGLP